MAAAAAQVGIHSDEDVNRQRGGGFPILNLHERALRCVRCDVLCAAFRAVWFDLIRFDLI